MERRREQVLGLLWWAAMAGVSWLVLRYALVWLLPFLLALGAAALLEPLIVRAQRRLHLRRSFTAAVLTLVLVGGVLAVLIALAVQVVEQAVALVSSLPELLASLPETMASLERRLEGFCAACPDGVRQTAEHMLDSLPRRAAELTGQVSSARFTGCRPRHGGIAAGTAGLRHHGAGGVLYPQRLSGGEGLFPAAAGIAAGAGQGSEVQRVRHTGKVAEGGVHPAGGDVLPAAGGTAADAAGVRAAAGGADRPDRRAAGVRDGDGAGALGGSGMPAGRRAPGHRCCWRCSR